MTRILWADRRPAITQVTTHYHQGCTKPKPPTNQKSISEHNIPNLNTTAGDHTGCHSSKYRKLRLQIAWMDCQKWTAEYFWYIWCLNFCCITELVEFFHKPHVVMVLGKIFSLDFFILIPIELCLNTIVTGHVYPFLTTAYHLLMAASCRSSLFSPPLASHLNISMAQIIEEWFPAPCKTMPQRIKAVLKAKRSPAQYSKV